MITISNLSNVIAISELPLGAFDWMTPAGLIVGLAVGAVIALIVSGRIRSQHQLTAGRKAQAITD